MYSIISAAVAEEGKYFQLFQDYFLSFLEGSKGPRNSSTSQVNKCTYPIKKGNLREKKSLKNIM